MSIELRVLTLNILNVADRWPERQPLLVSEFAAVQPEIAGIQEVLHSIRQDELLASAAGRRYAVRRAHTHIPEAGNSILVAEPLAARLLPPDAERDRFTLPLVEPFGRSAQRADIRLDRGTLRVVNTHLHHLTPDHAARENQLAHVLAWLASLEPVASTIVTGDLNSLPRSGVYRRMEAAGFRSAYAEANGREPEGTWPSGLVGAATSVPDPQPGTLDYIWLKGPIVARSARLCFDRPHADDPTLYPSDHRGVLAELELDL